MTPRAGGPFMLALALLAATSTARADASPWRAAEALGAPSWLRLGVEHRARVERLSPDFSAGSRGDVAALSLRTLLRLEVRGARVWAGLELDDSRAFANHDGALTPTIVDPLDVLQAYVGVKDDGLLTEGDEASLTVGRFTVDLGSRRLVARNDFRNTVNSFTGVDARWRLGPHSLRALAVVPVVRLPANPGPLARGELARDRENPGVLLWSLLFATDALAPRLLLESYVIGLHERDTSDFQSNDRRLVTPGARVVRAPAVGAVDWNVEVMAQLGTSRATSSSRDRAELRHRAGSVHLELGHRLDAPWRPRGALLFDVATGDNDPHDGAQGRFDPLFGARRFDFGPTGLWGPLSRGNLVSPGARLEASPAGAIELVATAREAWLASSRDAWVGAGVRDPSGDSGSFVGHHLDARARWAALPGNLVLEAGGALLVRGRFAREARGAPQGDPVYVYLQAAGTL